MSKLKSINQKYNPSEIEAKWQKIWEKEKIYSPNLDMSFDFAQELRPFYNLMMFPYPSAEGMHVGNMYAFTGADVYGRFQRMQGKSVFEPIGLDGFGIHSENYAIKQGMHPAEQAKISEKNFYRQLKSIGNSFDWSRTVETYKPEYYKWTQWLFVQLFKAGLAYRKKAPVNFCPSCKTVLADEQVERGLCERCNSIIEKRDLEQWFFKITKYADRLLNGLNQIDWDEKIKIAQKQWIGKSEGALVKFEIDDSRLKNKEIEVFTTRLDTLFGATFLVLSPGHPLITNITKAEVKKYVEEAKKKTVIEKAGEKTGVFSGLYVINPVNNEKIPVWIANYVLMGYGTGAIMAVPAHDQRDHDFAIKYKLPIIKVIQSYNEFQSLIMRKSVKVKEFKKDIAAKGMYVKDYYDWGLIVIGGDYIKNDYLKIIQNHLLPGSWYADADGSLRAVIFKNKIFTLPDEADEAFKYGKEIGISGGQLDWQTKENYAYCYEGIYGKLINSGRFDNLQVSQASDRLIELFPEKIRKEINYHLRDWLISRQRYWGPPIPMIYCESCDWQSVPEKDLPVELPFIKDYKPLGTGKSPLANHPEFYKTKCPKCQKEAKRETDVSDTFLDSAWYFLRYPSTDIDNTAFDMERLKKWLPVNMYIGGAEHSVLHLLYSRFMTMALKDLGLINFEEPFTQFRAHGLIIKDGAKMSKSKGNIVVSDLYIKKFGADTLRTYLMFMGPFSQGGDFRDTGTGGMFKFLKRIWALFSAGPVGSPSSVATSPQIMHKTIKKVTGDIEKLNYNTAIAALMEWYNFLSQQKSVSKEEIEVFVKLLAPFAPHISEELYQLLNGKKEFSSIHNSSWPKFDPKFLVKNELIIVVQINGKLRGNIVVDSAISKNKTKVEELAIKESNVQNHLKSKSIKKVIYIQGKIINFVAV